MYCPECGAEIIGNPKFCTNCGYKLSGEKASSDAPSPQVDTRQWFYFKGKDKMGPLTTSDMNEYVLRGAIKRDTMVWTTGYSDWRKAEQTELVNYMYNTAPELPSDAISEKWVWALATVPMVASLLLPSILHSMGLSTSLATIVVVILNIVFLSADSKELRNTGKDPGAWLFLGFILVPVYLFVRESKTNKNYAPGITWCVLFAISLIL